MMDARPALPLGFSVVSLIVGIGILIISITGIIIYDVVVNVSQTVVEQSDVYRMATERIQSHTEVELALGKPLTLGQPESIIVFTNLAEVGQANFVIPVSGSRSSGQAHIIASKQNGVWIFEWLTVTVEGQPTQIDLLKVPQ
jgi:hypothetical protein